jgi:hypothetical protein
MVKSFSGNSKYRVSEVMLSVTFTSALLHELEYHTPSGVTARLGESF